MNKPMNRSKLIGHILLAHACGLAICGMCLTIGTTAGFSISGAGLGIFLGGLASIPWIVGLMAAVWFYGGLIEQHPFYFALLGPLIVTGTYALSLGGFWESVAISTTASSGAYLALNRWHHCKAAYEEPS
jgi:hypothetical protein